MGCVFVGKGGKKQKGERGRREKVASYPGPFPLTTAQEPGYDAKRKRRKEVREGEHAIGSVEGGGREKGLAQ